MRTLKLVKVSAQVSLTAFVAVGLSGCSQNDCDDKTNTLPQSKIDECKEKDRTSSSGGAKTSTSSGYFAPYSSSSHLTSSGG